MGWVGSVVYGILSMMKYKRVWSGINGIIAKQLLTMSDTMIQSTTGLDDVVDDVVGILKPILTINDRTMIKTSDQAMQ